MLELPWPGLRSVFVLKDCPWEFFLPCCVYVVFFLDWFQGCLGCSRVCLNDTPQSFSVASSPTHVVRGNVVWQFWDHRLVFTDSHVGFLGSFSRKCQIIRQDVLNDYGRFGVTCPLRGVSFATRLVLLVSADLRLIYAEHWPTCPDSYDFWLWSSKMWVMVTPMRKYAAIFS